MATVKWPNSLSNLQIGRGMGNQRAIYGVGVAHGLEHRVVSWLTLSVSETGYRLIGAHDVADG